MNRLQTFAVLATLLCPLSILTSAADEPSEESATRKKNVESAEGRTTESNTSVSGRIVIMGPDGERREFDLSDQLPDGIGRDLKGMVDGKLFSGGTQSLEDDTPRFMLGVLCRPANPLLRSHLKLGTTGIVVSSVSADMPAAKAGLRKDDILVRAGDRDLHNLQDLIGAVAESEGQPITFQRIRNGDTDELTITPVKSTNRAAVSALEAVGGLEEYFQSMNLSQEQRDAFKKLPAGHHQFMIQSFGPAIELEDTGDFQGSFAEIISRAQKAEIDRVREKLKSKQIADDAANAAVKEEAGQHLRDLEERIRELEQQLKFEKSND